MWLEKWNWKVYLSLNIWRFSFIIHRIEQDHYGYRDDYHLCYCNYSKKQYPKDNAYKHKIFIIRFLWFTLRYSNER